ncbi:hypothetical protein JOB18_044851 [Solea senegalensis]|uniref:Uncharacterized protein n=1 Tax=Solea senegalensis TaxID=28829 RepID=A0AAV6QDP8_SOLSE|nr:hypothetical protein JOB18_044851 [Solea senegalensis]
MRIPVTVLVLRHTFGLRELTPLPTVTAKLLYGSTLYTLTEEKTASRLLAGGGGSGAAGLLSDGAPRLRELRAHGGPGVSDAGGWTLLPGSGCSQHGHDEHPGVRPA